MGNIMSYIYEVLNDLFVTTNPNTVRFYRIADKYSNLDEVIAALRREGLESSNLIIAVDFTMSNRSTGKKSFGGLCLHQNGKAQTGPYERAINIIGKTLNNFDEDNLIPCYGFGDTSTRDKGVFSFFPGDRPAKGMEEVVQRYRDLVPKVKLSGPTSFAAAVYNSMQIVAKSGFKYHILLIVADGQVTNETATIDAIVAASDYPLSIIMIGVGDGPWDTMQHFDDHLPERKFDNFQFVNFTEISRRYKYSPQRMEAVFALKALMEVPEQFKLIQRLDMLGKAPQKPMPAIITPVNPPGST